MQQTETYKLNLIESTDPFLPDGLNENTRKLEQVVSQHLEGMDARVTVLEAHKMAVGSYGGGRQLISIGFTPRFVMVWYSVGTTSNVLIATLPELGSNYAGITSAEEGFYVIGEASSGSHQFLALC